MFSLTDNPYYVMRYIGRYYAFNLEGKLITKFCSDGYARYFQEKRLSSMKSKIMGMMTSSQMCKLSGGASIDVTFNDRIYSEYTAVRTQRLPICLSGSLFGWLAVCLSFFHSVYLFG